MTQRLDRSLESLQTALERWECAVGAHPKVYQYLFPNGEDWRDLLRFKLLPHLRNGGCLIVSITGGTNTGKSTIINRLVGASVSPVRYTAAATSHPLLACPPSRLEDCMSGYLISKYQPRPVERIEDVLDSSVARDHFFVQVVEELSENHLYLDTPDIDSIEKDNWEVAEDIRAAGDVVIAVLTQEKYKDEKVISFYKEALSGGRIIFPLMNKARKRDDFAAAREQLRDFCAEVGLADPPCFVLPYDEDIDDHPAGAIPGLSVSQDLKQYLQDIDIPQVKEQVYHKTLDAMQRDMQPFIERTEQLGLDLHGTLQQATRRIDQVVDAYSPTPGEKVGVLLHEFIKQKRWRMTRMLGLAGAQILHTGKQISGKLLKRAGQESEELSPEEKIYAMNRSRLLAQTHRFLESCVDIRKQLSAPLDGAMPAQLPEQDAAIEKVLQQALGNTEESTLFREAMWEKLEAWWQEHPGQRKVIMGLDNFFIYGPTSAILLLGTVTGGFGTAELMASISYVSAPLYNALLRSDLSEWWLSIMEPWLVEQRAHFRDALEEHLAQPMFQELRALEQLMQSEDLAEIRKGVVL